MKKLVNKTVSVTRRLSGTGKARINRAFADFKLSKDDKIMEDMERESSKSVFIKLMNKYINRLHLQFDK